MRYTQLVNGIHVDSEYSDENVRELFIPLLEKLTALQKEKGGRLLVMLAAPPAAGKSTLSQFLEMLSGSTPGVTKLAAIGLDGFHRYRSDLEGKTAVRDGQEVPLLKIKGAPVTFDLERLCDAISRMKSEECCPWPVYDRTIHDPREDAVSVTEKIVLLEGNYLLLDEDGWRDVHKMADYTIRITAREQDLRDRLIRRKTATGMPVPDAERFVDFSDLYNVREVMSHFLKADLNLHMNSDGTYEKDVE